MLKPSTEGDEDKEHRRSVKECHRTTLLLERHGDYEYDDRVDVRDSGSHANEHVHVCSVMSQSSPGLQVEVVSSDKLKHTT